MASTIADLEQALRERWDLSTLAVYADLLQSRGDVRGELIALDLHLEMHDATPTLLARRRHLLETWLGTDPTQPPWNLRAFRLGFLDGAVHEQLLSDAADQLARVRASPAIPYLRRLTIVSYEDIIARTLELLATSVQPWLEHLRIFQRSFPSPAAPHLTAPLAEAAPRLHTLTLEGGNVLDAFDHPGVRRLEIEPRSFGFAAIMPAVVELAISGLVAQPAIPPLEQLPNLRKLDLGRNPADRAFAFLDAIDASRLATLGHLVLPALHTLEQLAAAHALMARLGDRVAVSLARSHWPFHEMTRDLRDPRLAIVEPVPWPARAKTSLSAGFTVQLPGMPDRLPVSLSRGLDRLEERFDEMPGHVQTTWRALFELIAQLPAHEQRPFPAARLLSALEWYDDVDPRRLPFGQWGRIQEALVEADLPADTTISIARTGAWPGRES